MSSMYLSTILLFFLAVGVLSQPSPKLRLQKKKQNSASSWFLSASTQDANDDDDDYTALMNCLVLSNANEADCTSTDDACQWCTSSSRSSALNGDDDKEDATTQLCVSGKAADDLEGTGDYDCSAPISDDDNANDDDSTNDDGNDDVGPDLFDCLTQAYEADCDKHQAPDGTQCVWCESTTHVQRNGRCVSAAYAAQMDGFMFHCNNNATEEEETFGSREEVNAEEE